MEARLLQLIKNHYDEYYNESYTDDDTIMDKIEENVGSEFVNVHMQWIYDQAAHYITNDTFIPTPLKIP